MMSVSLGTYDARTASVGTGILVIPEIPYQLVCAVLRIATWLDLKEEISRGVWR